MQRIKKVFENRPYIFFILPGFILYSVFIVYPILFGMSISFFKWSGIGPRTFVGLDNYKRLFFDARINRMFINALSNNLRYTLVLLTFFLAFQLLFAYLIYINIRGAKMFQLLIYLPNVISVTVICFFAQMILTPEFGVLNAVLDLVSLGHLKRGWMGEPGLNFIVMMIVIGWATIGYGMIIFVANMKGLSVELMEAAVIDGAGRVRRFFLIVLPLIWPALTNILILDVIWGLSVFDYPYILTGTAGGVNNSLDFLNMFFYRYAFGNGMSGDTQLGFASTICVVSFLIILVIAIIQLKLLKRLEVEE